MRIDEFKASASGTINQVARMLMASVGFDIVLSRPVVSGGLNPQVCLQYSSDGGFTWSNERWKEIGKIGEHRKSIYWDRLGMARDRVFKIVVTDPCKWIITDALIDDDEGTS